jgi:long-subunit acyl-CoA synthetase (AMP-forming)
MYLFIVGYVGTPLPGVQAQIAKNCQNQNYEILIQGSAGGGATMLPTKFTSGELHVKGPNVFKGYWKNPKATREAFTEDGWFKTGVIVDLT